MENQVADIHQEERSWWNSVLIVLLAKTISYFAAEVVNVQLLQGRESSKKSWDGSNQGI